MMALELYMLGLIVQDMSKSLEFYRRLGLAIPEGSEGKPHVQIKMGNGLTFFLDAKPSLWDPGFSRSDDPEREEATDPYRSVLEFYLKTGAAVEAKYAELTGLGYQGYRAPYKTSFGMCFALMKDPDGNTLLLSGDLEKSEAAQTG
ncbi:MAG TPA: VOC family protein [Ktedonobacterales bacterium]|nr:VOC family protein [Ktedonobacterales bacterium]